MTDAIEKAIEAMEYVYSSLGKNQLGVEGLKPHSHGVRDQMCVAAMKRVKEALQLLREYQANTVNQTGAELPLCPFCGDCVEIKYSGNVTKFHHGGHQDCPLYDTEDYYEGDITERLTKQWSMRALPISHPDTHHMRVAVGALEKAWDEIEQLKARIATLTGPNPQPVSAALEALTVQTRDRILSKNLFTCSNKTGNPVAQLHEGIKWGIEQALAQAGVPDGWVLVPKELSEEQMNPIAEAVRGQIVREFGDHGKASLGYFKRIYRAGHKAMLAAAPVSAKEG